MSRLCSTNLRFICSLSGTVIRNIWDRIILAVIYTAVLVSLHKFVRDGFHIKSEWTKSTVTVLGTVTGLLLVFRTNTAYDRYWEGRKLWSSITHNIRSLTRYVWTVVPDQTMEDTAEKISMINLLVAFPFAVKNYLREDYSYESPDLKELLSRVPQFASAAGAEYYSNASGIPYLKTDHVTIEPALLDEVKGPSKRGSKLRSRKRRWRAHAEPTETNIPLEILVHFTSYMNKLATMEKPVPMTFLNTMNTALTSLSDALSGLERIFQTPVPFAYVVHLEHVVWLYILLLPFELIEKLEWWTIAVVALGSFCFFGILDVGYEIENPFGTDYNDLPLDEICNRIKREASETLGIPLAGRTGRKTSKVNDNPPVLPNTLNESDLSHKTAAATEQDSLLSQQHNDKLRKL